MFLMLDAGHGSDCTRADVTGDTTTRSCLIFQSHLTDLDCLDCCLDRLHLTVMDIVGATLHDSAVSICTIIEHVPWFVL